jgi:hypothetical protein
LVIETPAEVWYHKYIKGNTAEAENEKECITMTDRSAEKIFGYLSAEETKKLAEYRTIDELKAFIEEFGIDVSEWLGE